MVPAIVDQCTIVLECHHGPEYRDRVMTFDQSNLPQGYRAGLPRAAVWAAFGLASTAG